MRTYKCLYCHSTFTEADRAWDVAIETGLCPECHLELHNFPASVSKPNKKKIKGSGFVPWYLGFTTAVLVSIAIFGLNTSHFGKLGWIVLIGGVLAVRWVASKLINKYRVRKMQNTAGTDFLRHDDIANTLSESSIRAYNFCSNCGTKALSPAKYCHSCGHQLQL